MYSESSHSVDYKTRLNNVAVSALNTRVDPKNTIDVSCFISNEELDELNANISPMIARIVDDATLYRTEHPIAATIWNAIKKRHVNKLQYNGVATLSYDVNEFFDHAKNGAQMLSWHNSAKNEARIRRKLLTLKPNAKTGAFFEERKARLETAIEKLSCEGDICCCNHCPNHKAETLIIGVSCGHMGRASIAEAFHKTNAKIAYLTTFIPEETSRLEYYNGKKFYNFRKIGASYHFWFRHDNSLAYESTCEHVEIFTKTSGLHGFDHNILIESAPSFGPYRNFVLTRVQCTIDVWMPDFCASKNMVRLPDFEDVVNNRQIIRYIQVDRNKVEQLRIYGNAVQPEDNSYVKFLNYARAQRNTIRLGLYQVEGQWDIGYHDYERVLKSIYALIWIDRSKTTDFLNKMISGVKKQKGISNVEGFFATLKELLCGSYKPQLEKIFGEMEGAFGISENTEMINLGGTSWAAARLRVYASIFAHFDWVEPADRLINTKIKGVSGHIVLTKQDLPAVIIEPPPYHVEESTEDADGVTTDDGWCLNPDELIEMIKKKLPSAVPTTSEESNDSSLELVEERDYPVFDDETDKTESTCSDSNNTWSNFLSTVKEARATTFNLADPIVERNLAGEARMVGLMSSFLADVDVHQRNLTDAETSDEKQVVEPQRVYSSPNLNNVDLHQALAGIEIYQQSQTDVSDETSVEYDSPYEGKVYYNKSGAGGTRANPMHKHRVQKGLQFNINKGRLKKIINEHTIDDLGVNADMGYDIGFTTTEESSVISDVSSHSEVVHDPMPTGKYNGKYSVDNIQHRSAALDEYCNTLRTDTNGTLRLLIEDAANIAARMQRKISNKLKLSWIIGGPGCGKSQYIRDNYHQAFVITPVRDLKKDYKHMKVETTHVAIKKLSGRSIAGPIVIDECFVTHFGFVELIHRLQPYCEIICVGDPRQIGYISFTDEEHKYATGSFFDNKNVRKNLNVCYRCPLDVVEILNRKYGYDMIGVSKVQQSINFIDELPDNHQAKHIVFTQEHKVKLQSQGRDCLSVHESQGKTFSDVVLCVDGDAGALIMKDYGHSAVSISRHTGRIDVLDKAGYREHLFGSSNMRGNIERTVPLIEVNKIIDQPLDLQRIDTKPRTVTPMVDPIIVTKILNRITPDSAFAGDVSFDLSKSLTGLSLKKDAFKAETIITKKKLWGPVYTRRYDRRCTGQVLQCASERYGNPTKNLPRAESERLAQHSADKFFDVFIGETYCTFNYEDLWESFEENLANAHVKYDLAAVPDLDLTDPAQTKVKFFLKTIDKWKAAEPCSALKAGQGIAAWTRALNSFYCVLFRTMWKTVASNLKNFAMLYNGADEKKLHEIYKIRYNRMHHNFDNDFSEFDKSQNATTRRIEELIYNRLGLTKEITTLFFSMRSKRKFVCEGLFAMDVADKKDSGAPETLLGNTLVNMAVIAACFDIVDPSYAGFKGDDSHIRAAACYEIKEVKTQFERAGLRFKLEQPNVSLFCGNFMTEYALLPDVVNIASRVISRVYGGKEDLENYQVAIRDWLVRIHSEHDRVVCMAANQRYYAATGTTTTDISTIISFLDWYVSADVQDVWRKCSNFNFTMDKDLTQSSGNLITHK